MGDYTARRQQRGFTLVEVLVALAIVALALGAIITAVSHFADSAHYLQQKTLAGWAAHNLLVETTLSNTIPATGKKDDDDVDYAGREWLTRVSSVETPDPNILRVKVEIWPETADRDDDTPLVVLSGFFAK